KWIKSGGIFCLRFLLILITTTHPNLYSQTEKSDLDTLSIKTSFLNEAELITPVNPEILIETIEDDIDYYKLVAAGIVDLTAGYFVFNEFNNLWWENRSQDFNLRNSADSYYGMDKLGRFYSFNLMAHGFSGGYEASGFNAISSTWYSAGTALFVNALIEINDGYTQNNGFSRDDFTVDLFAFSFYVIQYYYPFTKHIQPRFSYKNNPNSPKSIFNDYYNQKYWLAFRVEEYLPNSLSEFWPDFLMVSVGTGISGTQEKTFKHREYYIAFDIDAEKIPLYGGFWVFVKNTLNYFHFPMPGIRITPESTFFEFVF
ncbi:MAG: YfiM family protein, partial [Melioribacteraceae bacterium]|nr:YfiM family protein [Melioribacteraceae bacterium]